jgi:hypothetical protein
VIPPLVPLDEILKIKRHIAALQVAAPAELVGDVARHILRPFFGGVKTDNPDRVPLLPLDHVDYDGFKVGPLDVGFAVSSTVSAEVVNDDVDVLIVVVRDDRRRPPGSTHRTLHANEPVIKRAVID